MKRTPLIRRTPLRPRSRTNRKPPAHRRYVAWIRTLPCAICGIAGVEAAHTNVLGRSGMAQRSTNRSCIPLCPACHRLGIDSYHQITPEWRWADYHGLDLVDLVSRLNRCWDLMQEARHAAAA